MKKLFFGLVIALAASASQASYLWWEMTTASMGDIGAWAKASGETSDTIMARVVAVDDAGNVIGRSASAGFLDEWYTAPNQTVDLSIFGTEAEYQSYSYYVEVVHASADPSQQTFIGKNNKATKYNDLGSVTASLDVTPTTALWHGGSGSPTAAPEPTSAMLMLLGVAGLALKRKQKKA